MVDLYAVLGVSRDANSAEIRREFRKRARGAHPDGGGSIDAFNELKNAYDILSDPTRRRRYDETGDVGGSTADPRRNKVIEILSVGLDQALLKLGRARSTEKESDIVHLAVAILVEKRKELTARKRLFEKALDDTHRLEGRFLVSEGENLMDVVVAHRISSCRKQVDMITEHIDLFDEALSLLYKTHFVPYIEIIKDIDRRVEVADDLNPFRSYFDGSSLAQFI